MIKFDPEAYKTSVFEGPYETLAALKADCVAPSADDAVFKGWAETTGHSADQTDILTTLFNNHYLSRVHATLQAQADHNVERGSALKVPGLSFQLPKDLVDAFEQIGGNESSLPVQVLAFEGTKETILPALQEEFFGVVVATAVCPTREDAAARNQIASVMAPSLIVYDEPINYISDWWAERADIVFVNSYAHYMTSEDDVARFTLAIAGTGAKYAVFANTVETESDNEEFWGQRYFGGIIPTRRAPKGELSQLMTSLGYKQVSTGETPATYDKTPGTAATRQLPVESQLVFKLR